MEMKITMLDGEVWYGPSSKHGQKMPHDKNTKYWVDIETSATCNQDNPLLISNMGRFIFAPLGFTLLIEDGVINVSSKYGEIDYTDGYGSLKGAFTEAMRRHFPPRDGIPPEEFFRIPQYNTWIELIY
ncbi:MAG: glycoside hydrolase, partial [Clostridia bacterium]|nr:glycoside hydrolase [Clostridia bacterium]